MKKQHFEIPQWIQKEIDLYNNRSPLMQAITRVSLVSIVITILSHIKIIIVK